MKYIACALAVSLCASSARAEGFIETFRVKIPLNCATNKRVCDDNLKKMSSLKLYMDPNGRFASKVTIAERKANTQRATWVAITEDGGRYVCDFDGYVIDGTCKHQSGPKADYAAAWKDQ
jgi:hypothetical protein